MKKPRILRIEASNLMTRCFYSAKIVFLSEYKQKKAPNQRYRVKTINNNRFLYCEYTTSHDNFYTSYHYHKDKVDFVQLYEQNSLL